MFQINIFLTDDTIEVNIAFGVDQDKIDQKRVEIASKIANLHILLLKIFLVPNYSW